MAQLIRKPIGASSKSNYPIKENLPKKIMLIHAMAAIQIVA